MEEVVDLSSDREGNKSKSGDDIVKEVASAMEEEVRDESTTSKDSSVESTLTSFKQEMNESYVKVGLSTSMLAATLPESPTAATIRSSKSRGYTEAKSSISTTGQISETLASPLNGVNIKDQEPEEEQERGSVWGWMSSAVNISESIIQTTQNLGKNLVEKTKVG